MISDWCWFGGEGQSSLWLERRKTSGDRQRWGRAVMGERRLTPRLASQTAVIQICQKAAFQAQAFITGYSRWEPRDTRGICLCLCRFVGFPRTLSCRLSNTSLVPMTFSLRIPGDGSGAPSVSSFVQMSDNTRLSWRKGAHGDLKPSEFTITPCRGTVRSQGLLDIQVQHGSSRVCVFQQVGMKFLWSLMGTEKAVAAVSCPASTGPLFSLRRLDSYC